MRWLGRSNASLARTRLRGDTMTTPTPKLLGTYKTPRLRIGAKSRCDVRGDVTVCGYTDAPLSWPLGKIGRHKGMIVFRRLERALRREASLAVGEAWGVTQQTVWAGGSASASSVR